MPRWALAALAVVLILNAAISVGYALGTPAWQNPDEPAHYAYIAQVAKAGCCPVIAPGDWDQAYLSTLTSARFAPETLARLDTVQYEDHQPPLYYLLASLVYRLADGALVPLRLLSVAFAMGIGAAAFALGRVLAPGRPGVWLGAAALAGGIPQAAAMHAAVNNDALAHLLASLMLLALAAWVIRGPRAVPGGAWTLGLLAGLCALTKVTVVFIALLVPLALLIRWLAAGREGGTTGLLGAFARFAVPAVALVGLWWARNIGVYGFPDVFGLAAHDAVVVGQPLAADFIARTGLSTHLSSGAATVFNSFWGQFGWMALPLQPGVYAVLAAVCALALAGLVVGAIWPHPAGDGVPPILRRAAWALMGAAIAFASAQLVYYNLQFVQFQGRYLFPALAAFAVCIAAGLATLAERAVRLTGRWARAFAVAPAALLAVGLAMLNGYIIARVLPLLRP